ncbi:vWA domain-containing protein [Nocardia takedensis]
MVDKQPKGAKVFPVYVLVDVSYSMLGSPISAANDIVPSLVDACKEYTTLADTLRFSLITFSDTAKTLVPMGAYDQIQIPQLSVEGATSYGEGFREVRRNIDNDVAQLKADGYVVMRPSVFFITDGEPTDSPSARLDAWQELVDKNRRTHPNVVTFGVGEAVAEDTLKEFVSHKGKAFKTKQGVDAAQALRSIIEMLVMSVVASSNAAQGGGGEGLILDANAVDDDLDEVM